MPTHSPQPPSRSRRDVLAAGAAVAGGGLLAACSGSPSGARGGVDGMADGKNGGPHDNVPSGYVSPDGPEVAAAEKERSADGTVRKFRVTATFGMLNLGDRTVGTWAYGDEFPGKEVRVTAGDQIHMTLDNHLPASTSVHWHGIRLRNDMDGVPEITQRGVQPGASFTYQFTVPDPGTYWLHPHTGVQIDRGLYAPVIVDDPREPLRYDKEWIVLIDDWLDGVDGSTPDQVLAELDKGMGDMGHSQMRRTGQAHAHKGHGGKGHGGMDMNGLDLDGMDRGDMDAAMDAMDPDRDADTDTGRDSGHKDNAPRETGKGPGHAAVPRQPADGPAPMRPSRILVGGTTSTLLGGVGGHVNYPYYLINGRAPENPETFQARPGDRIRIRIINASGETGYRVALGGHRMTITHTDGFPVEHATTDALLIGMAERYDVLVTVKDGAFPLTALAEGKTGAAMAVLRTGGGEAPGPDTRPKELQGKVLRSIHLKSAESVRLEERSVDRTLDFELTGSVAKWNWAFNGKPYTPDQRYPVAAGERVRMTFRNRTKMWHPVHLHGHTYQLPDGGPRKDTTVLVPGQTLSVEMDADNPGLWMMHCHNIYHSESGMMTVLGYRKQ
ncbi:multicopper oxidase family protein [Streptomyces gilvosporeus]|uniref:Copper oxidase n=1 Tax=Streptomyces gilvosporeus TaxID=553510 RepID=A0A1V0TQC3_9ACTN|nr:multicopper oxidase family protein [Streptomyces gilvosporeus]ARF55020.1 copper oxidase [Streptomyces gilvosporeus]